MGLNYSYTLYSYTQHEYIKHTKNRQKMRLVLSSELGTFTHHYHITMSKGKVL